MRFSYDTPLKSSGSRDGLNALTSRAADSKDPAYKKLQFVGVVALQLKLAGKNL
jgi:hypothetical protein